MSSVVSRYGSTHVGYSLIKSAPRVVVATAALAIGAEAFGNGLMDVVWNSLNRGKQWPDLLKQIERRQKAQNPVETMNQANGLKRNVA
jgi:hypothetical protein